MQKYNVTLRSQTDDQARLVTLNARSDDEARIRAEAAELEVIDYSLYADRYLASGHGAQGDNASPVDATANRQLAELIERECELLPSGKVRGPASRARAKYHQHCQQVPYKVEAVELVPADVVDTNRVIRELLLLQHDEEQWNQVLQALRDNGTPLAAVTGWQYGVPKKNQYDGTAVVDWNTDTIKVALAVTTGGVQDTSDFWNDITTEVTGTGYTAGGATLASPTATYDTATDQMRLDGADTSWTTSTISADFAEIYKSTGTSTTSPLIGEVQFGATVSTTAGTFQITWDSTGIVVDDLT